MTRHPALWAGLIVSAVVALTACGGSAGPGVLEGEGASSESDALETDGGCSTPEEGCPCTTPGQAVACGHVVLHDGKYVTCQQGKRTCEDGTWGACVGAMAVYQGKGP